MSIKSRSDVIRILKAHGVNIKESSDLIDALTDAMDAAFDEGFESAKIQETLDQIRRYHEQER